MKKNISILGSTGSIGTQTLDVVRNLKNINVKCLSTNKNIDLLLQQIEEFSPEVVCVMDDKLSKELKQKIKNKDIEVKTGLEGLIYISTYKNVDLVVNSVVGNIGLIPTIEAIKYKKDIAIANKETLVSTGELVMDLVKKNNINLYPIDSEHSAIFQCIQGNAENKIEKIILTASGGPFRTKTNEELEKVTVEDALKHPNWSMGKKITIDSATLMNKGLEIIEAKWLFNLELSQIDVIVHPQSIIHSMVQFEDSSIIAQLGCPDMRIPIQYALNYPNRTKNDYPRLDLFLNNKLEFEKPRIEDFECLKLAIEAIKIGGTMPAVLNAANEVTVERFLNKEIKFLSIPKLIKKAMLNHNVKFNYTLGDVLEADNWARNFIREVSIFEC